VISATTVLAAWVAMSAASRVGSGCAACQIPHPVKMKGIMMMAFSNTLSQWEKPSLFIFIRFTPKKLLPVNLFLWKKG
jgi:hypothetical protein